MAVLPVLGKKLVVKVDMLVESTDIPPGMSHRQAARKAVAACVSDFAAKGVRPDSFLVSLGIRRGTSSRQVKELAGGFGDAAREWHLKLVGGDTNEAKELVIDCAMLGYADRVCGRGGARAGDCLVVTGSFGLQPSGLRILTGKAKAAGSFRKRATSSVLNPEPNLDVGLALGAYLTSGMDSSDGLARSLHTLARASGVGFEVETVPLARGVKKFARSNSLSDEKLGLEGGEEYVIVGTVGRRKLEAAAEAARKAGGDLLVIGRATSHAGRVTMKSKGRAVPIRDEGWTHLG